MLGFWIVFHLFFGNGSTFLLSLFTKLSGARIREDQVKLNLGVESYSLEVVFDEGSV